MKTIGPDKFFIGADQPWQIAVYDTGEVTGIPTDLTSKVMEFYIRRNRLDIVPIVVLSTATGTITVDPLLSNVAVLHFVRADTEGLLTDGEVVFVSLWDMEASVPLYYSELIPTQVAARAP